MCTWSDSGNRIAQDVDTRSYCTLLVSYISKPGHHSIRPASKGKGQIEVKLQRCSEIHMTPDSILFYLIKTHICIDVHFIVYAYSLHIYIAVCMITLDQFRSRSNVWTPWLVKMELNCRNRVPNQLRAAAATFLTYLCNLSYASRWPISFLPNRL